MNTSIHSGIGFRKGLAIIGWSLSMICLLPAALPADGPLPQPGPARFEGLTHGEYAAQWYQWALSIPAEMNPVIDPTGEFAHVGQEGNVWFLAGTFGGDAERSITVPSGTALFIPIWNTAWITFPEDELQDPEEIVAFMNDSFREAAETGTFALEIDGVVYEDMEPFLTESPIFSTSLLIEGDDTVYEPCYTVGYYALIPPLSVGGHHISIDVEVAAIEFALCVQYEIEVEPGRKQP